MQTVPEESISNSVPGQGKWRVIIINRNNTIERVSLPISKSKKSFSIFIIDSGIQKETQFMVNLFLDRINNNSFNVF